MLKLIELLEIPRGYVFDKSYIRDLLHEQNLLIAFDAAYRLDCNCNSIWSIWDFDRFTRFMNALEKEGFVRKYSRGRWQKL